MARFFRQRDELLVDEGEKPLGPKASMGVDRWEDVDA
jgi:hypothetical protein